MKPLYTISAIAAILLSTSAQAGDFFFKPNIGADYQYTYVDYKNGNDDVLEKSLHGGDVHIGARIHKNLGFEAGYLRTAEATKDNVLGSGLDTKIKLSGVTFDALGYLPLGNGKFELIGTAGITHLKADLTIPGIGSDNESETKGRVGGGAQYWLSDNFNIRTLVRYQGASFDDVAKGAVIGNVGLNYQF